MASKNRVLHTVIKSFPAYGMHITELYDHSSIFRSICEDYAACLRVMERLESNSRMTSKGYKKEYEELLQDLEKELISKLEAQE